MRYGDTWVAEAELFIRKAMGGGTMILGILRDEEWSETAKGDEIWLATITVMAHRRFDLERQCEGLRADQILCTAFPIDKLKEIKVSEG